MRGKSRNHWWIGPLVLAVLPAAAAGQGVLAPSGPGSAPADTVSLYGVVVDSASGEPIPAARVRVLGLEREDLTHNDGVFHLSRLPPGPTRCSWSTWGTARRSGG